MCGIPGDRTERLPLDEILDFSGLSRLRLVAFAMGKPGHRINPPAEQLHSP
jgi:hypothetical protein